MRAVNTIAPPLRLCRSAARIRYAILPLKLRARYAPTPVFACSIRRYGGFSPSRSLFRCWRRRSGTSRGLPPSPRSWSRSPVPVAVWVAIWVAVRTLVWVPVNPPCTDGCKGGCTDSANVGPSALRVRARRAASTPEKSAPEFPRSGLAVSGGLYPAVGGGVSPARRDTPGHIPLPWSWSSSPVRLYLPQPGDTRPTCRCTCDFVPHRPPGPATMVTIEGF